MAVCPLIKPIQTRKGMFYTFQSSLEDLNLTFNNNTNKFRFSKFALLRIPEIGIPTTLTTDNRIQFLAVGETPILDGLSVNQNINLALSFENYALNFESMLISQDSYQREKKLNVSERVFWKWMKEMGAIRWRPANSSEVISTLPTGEKRWAEDWYDASSSTYNRVVKYIGDVDVINSVRNKDNSYSEIYVHVPTNVGTTPTVLFNSKADNNYHADMIMINSPGDPLDVEFLNGRHWDDSHPYAGMNLLAFFDLDSGASTQKLTDTLNTVVDWSLISPSYWWGANQLNNAYHTDQAAYFGGLYGNTTVSNPKVQKIYKTYTDGDGNTREVEYLRSTLDGVVVDFELSNYKVAADDPNIKSLAQLADSVANYDFEFNAILVYYDIYDPVPQQNQSEPASVTNLYGIYFLNKVEQAGIDFEIPMIQKEKPDAINRTNGNAFAHKINIKFDTSIEDVAVEKSINDYSTFGLDLFLDVLTELRRIQTTLNEKIAELENLSNDLLAAKQALVSTSGLDQLDQRVTVLETTVQASVAAFDEADAIMQLIASLNQQITDLYNNRTSILMSYDLAPFKNGYGVNIDKSVPGQVTFSNNAQLYSSSSQINLASTTVNVANVCTLDLGVSNTYIKHYKPVSNINLNPSWNLSADLEIRINDSVNTWKTGQIMKFVIDTPIIPGDYVIYIKTDAKNATNQSAAYGRIITTLTETDFPQNFGRTGRPMLEITCTDSVNLTFQVDKIIR